MLIYKSHYLTVNLLEIRYLLHLTWTHPAELLDQVGLYAEAAKFLQNRIKRRGRLILWDFTVIQERIDQRFMQWIFDQIIPQIASVKLKKIALVLTNKQLINNISNPAINLTQIFATQPEAMKWLTENAETKPLGLSHHRHH